MDPFTCKYCEHTFGGYKFEGAALLKVHYLSEHLFEEYDKKQQEIKLLALRQNTLNSAKSSRKRSHSRTVPSLNADRQNANQKNADSPDEKEQIKQVVGQKKASFNPGPDSEDAEKPEKNGNDLSKASRKRLPAYLPKLHSDSIAPAVKFKQSRIGISDLNGLNLKKNKLMNRIRKKPVEQIPAERKPVLQQKPVSMFGRMPLQKPVPLNKIVLDIPLLRYQMLLQKPMPLWKAPLQPKPNLVKKIPAQQHKSVHLQEPEPENTEMVKGSVKKGKKKKKKKKKSEAKPVANNNNTATNTSNLATVCSRLLSLIPKKPVDMSKPIDAYANLFNDQQFYFRFGHGSALEFFKARLSDDITMIDKVMEKGGVATMVSLKEKQAVVNLTKKERGKESGAKPVANNNKTVANTSNLGTVCIRLLFLIPKNPVEICKTINSYANLYNDHNFYSRFGHESATKFFKAHLSNDITIIDKVTNTGCVTTMVSLKEKQI